MTKRHKEKMLLSLFRTNVAKLTSGYFSEPNDIVNVKTFFDDARHNIKRSYKNGYISDGSVMKVLIMFRQCRMTNDIADRVGRWHPNFTANEKINYCAIPAMYVSENAINRKLGRESRLMRTLDEYVVEIAKDFLENKNISSIEEVELNLALMGKLLD